MGNLKFSHPDGRHAVAEFPQYLPGFSRTVLSHERLAFGNYLSPDFPTAWQAAMAIGDETLKAAATLAVEERLKLARQWRQTRLHEAISNDGHLRADLEFLPPERQTEVLSGEVDFSSFVHLVTSTATTAREAASASKRAGRKNLQAALRSLHHPDFPLSDTRQPRLEFVAVTEDGQVFLFANWREAKNWARATGKVVILSQLGGMSRVFEPDYLAEVPTGTEAPASAVDQGSLQEPEPTASQEAELTASQEADPVSSGPAQAAPPVVGLEKVVKGSKAGSSNLP